MKCLGGAAEKSKGKAKRRNARQRQRKDKECGGIARQCEGRAEISGAAAMTAKHSNGNAGTSIDVFAALGTAKEKL